MSLPILSDKTLALQSGRKTRAQHLAMIRALARTEGEGAALKEPPRKRKPPADTCTNGRKVRNSTA